MKVPYKVEIGTQDDPQSRHEGACEFYMVGSLPHSVGDFMVILQREPRAEDVISLLEILTPKKPSRLAEAQGKATR